MANWREEKIKEELNSINGFQIDDLYAPRGGSSHCTFRKAGCQPITIPRHEPIKRVYVEMVKQIVENEVDNDEDIE